MSTSSPIVTEPLPLHRLRVTRSLPVFLVVKPHERDGLDHRVYIKGAEPSPGKSHRAPSSPRFQPKIKSICRALFVGGSAFIVKGAVGTIVACHRLVYRLTGTTQCFMSMRGNVNVAYSMSCRGRKSEPAQERPLPSWRSPVSPSTVLYV